MEVIKLTLSKITVDVQKQTIKKSFEHQLIINSTENYYRCYKNDKCVNYYITDSTIYFPKSKLNRIITPSSGDIYGEYTVYLISNEDIVDKIESSDKVHKILTQIFDLVEKRLMATFNKVKIARKTLLGEKKDNK